MPILNQLLFCLASRAQCLVSTDEVFNGMTSMKLFLRAPFAGYRQTLTGLGLILAATSQPVQAGWDCSLDANGEWVCLAAGAYKDGSGATVVSVPDSSEIDDAVIEATASGKSVDTVNINRTVTQPTATSVNEPTAKETAINESTATPDTDTAASQSVTAKNLTAPTHVSNIGDDWVPIEKLTEEQKQQLDDAENQQAKLCCGMYVDPSDAADKTNPTDAQVNAHADETDTDIPNQVTTLTGNVQVRQESV